VGNPNFTKSVAKSAGLRPLERDGAEKTTSKDNISIAVLDRRSLNRECLVRSLRGHSVQMLVADFSTGDQFFAAKDLHASISAILLSVGGRRVSDVGVANDFAALTRRFPSTPILLLADSDDLTETLRALQMGARGYVPSSVGIDVCVEAIRLVLAGGTFVPASCVLSMDSISKGRSEANRFMAGLFTPRQEEVAMALRRGKANKIIAHELSLRESTVKVHIRNIMKKVKATNRTEVAYKINRLLQDEVGDISSL
jgi:DNA-binding NarL/FixJ family response regulator